MSFSRSNSTNYVSYKNHILLKEDYLAHILDSIGVKYYWYFVLMLENQWWCETRHIEALLSRVSVIVGSSKPVVITRTIGSEEKKKLPRLFTDSVSVRSLKTDLFLPQKWIFTDIFNVTFIFFHTTMYWKKCYIETTVYRFVVFYRDFSRE